MIRILGIIIFFLGVGVGLVGGVVYLVKRFLRTNPF